MNETVIYLAIAFGIWAAAGLSSKPVRHATGVVKHKIVCGVTFGHKCQSSKVSSINKEKK